MSRLADEIEVRCYAVEQWVSGHLPGPDDVLDLHPTWDVSSDGMLFRWLVPFLNSTGLIERLEVGGNGVVCPVGSHLARSAVDAVVWIRGDDVGEPLTAQANQWEAPDVCAFTTAAYGRVFGDDGLPPPLTRDEARVALSMVTLPAVDMGLYVVPELPITLRQVLKRLHDLPNDSTVDFDCDASQFSEIRIGLDNENLDECVLRLRRGVRPAVMLFENPCLPIWLSGRVATALCSDLELQTL